MATKKSNTRSTGSAKASRASKAMKKKQAPRASEITKALKASSTLAKVSGDAFDSVNDEDESISTVDSECVPDEDIEEQAPKPQPRQDPSTIPTSKIKMAVVSKDLKVSCPICGPNGVAQNISNVIDYGLAPENSASENAVFYFIKICRNCNQSLMYFTDASFKRHATV